MAENKARPWSWASFMEAFGKELTGLYEGRRTRRDMASLYSRHRLPDPQVAAGDKVTFTFKAETAATEIAPGVTLGMLNQEGRDAREDARLLKERQEKYDWLHRHRGEFGSADLRAALGRLGFPVPAEETHVVADVYFEPDRATRIDFTLPEKVKQDDVVAKLETQAQDPQSLTLAQRAFPNAHSNGVKRVKIVAFDVADTWADQKTITAQGYQE